MSTTNPTESSPPLPHIDLSKPRYDQNTYTGRARHFYETANPLNLFVSTRKLAEAAQLVKDHKWVALGVCMCVCYFVHKLIYFSTSLLK